MTTKKLFLDLESEGLYSWYGNKITCICAKTSDGEIFKESLRDKDEGMLIRYFLNWVKERQDHVLVFHNGVKFDIPFICARACVNGFSYDKFSFLTKMDFSDTMKVASKWIKLDDLATLYGIENKTGDGKGAVDLYKLGRFDDLENYCLKDVEITEQVYNKMSELVKWK